MARYEVSSKFWAIEVDGKSFTTTYGKIGSDGRSTTKSFASAAEARQAADKLIAQKEKKGYALVDDGDEAEDSPARPGARYFEFVDGKSSKFWEVLVDGSALETRHGKIGTDGRITRKSLASPKAAEEQRDKLVAQKTKKGYVERGGSAGNGGSAGAAAPALDPRNPALEAAIHEDPDSDDGFAVLADWLQSQGDPRGELISLELAGKKRRAKALFAKHASTFLGPLEAHQEVRDEGWNNASSSLRTNAQAKAWEKTHRQAFLWHRGYIRRVRLSHDAYSVTWDGRCVDVLDEVLRHPSGRFVVEFAFHSNGDPNDDDLQELIDLLAKKAPASTRKITLGDNVDQISWHHTGSLAKLWKRVPKLRELEIESGDFEVGKMVAPGLERAVFVTGGLSKACGRAIAKATMPKIRHLEIYYGDSNYGAGCSIADVRPLLARTDLPELRYLGLENAEFTDDIARALPKAKVLAGLETLDLSQGTLTDAGAAALAAAKPALGHLKCLDLSDNFLTKDGIKAVKGLCAKVVTKNQREPFDWDDEDRYYVSVGE